MADPMYDTPQDFRDITFISYPRSGRNLVKLFITRACGCPDTNAWPRFIRKSHDPTTPPQYKTLLMFRNPARAILSHYKMNCGIFKGRKKPPRVTPTKEGFEKFIDGAKGVSLWQRIYDTWWDRDIDKHVILYEDLLHDTRKTIQGFVDYLELPQFPWKIDNARPYCHLEKGRQFMTDEQLDRIEDELREPMRVIGLPSWRAEESV